VGELVELGIVGGVGDELVFGAGVVEGFFPEFGGVGVDEELGAGGEREPGGGEEFIFELAFFPSSVADEGADDGVGVFLAVDGVFGGDAVVIFEEVGGVIPVKGGEGEVFLGDGAAEVDADVFERGEFGVFDEVAYGFGGGVVEDVALGAGVVVVGEEDDGFVKKPVGDDGGGEDELASEGGGCFHFERRFLDGIHKINRISVSGFVFVRDGAGWR